MHFTVSFLAGLGCGICIGMSMVAVKNYFAKVTKAARVIRKFASQSEHKLALVVRTDLNMGKGKIGAQCGHAAVGAYEKASLRDPVALKCWNMTGQAKIALKIDSLEEIKQIADNAMKSGLITSMIRDAGKTQIPANSITVVAIGPAPKEAIDLVTGHLKLL